MPVNQVQLRSFVLDGLRAIGADPKEISREIYQATLPTAEVQRIFANQKEITFTFQRAMLEDYPKAELVTIGGHLLNRLIDVLRKRAQAATVMLISHEPTPPAQFACPLPTRNSKAVGATVIPGYTPFTQFLLKTTYLTDEKFEQIFEVSVDHATGKLEIGGDTFSKLLPKAVKPGRPAEHIFAQLDETQALRLAFDAVKPQVEQRTQTIEATVSRHLDEELARIRAFYAASAAPAGAAPAIAPPDPNTAAAGAALSAEEAAQQQAELERQQKEEQEKERKLEMARERYRLTVHTGLLSAITVFRPLHRYTFQVSPARPGAMAGALPLTVDFDPVGGTALLPTCDTCKGAMAQVCSCEQGPHLVCQACAQVCTSCGRGRCTTHALKGCSVDGAGVCDECLFEADECGHAACPQHQQRCAVSGRAVCATCARPCSTCGKVSCPTHLLGCHIDQTPVCVNCVVRCVRCNEVTCTKDQVRCRTCGEISCTGCASRCADPNCRRFHCNIHLQACATSGCVGMFCPTCVKTCAQCGRAHCPAHTTTCHECQQPVGAGCAITCVSHGHPLCRKHALPCNVCNRLACPKGLINCASCGRATCLQEIQRCSLDGQPFCPSCSDRCATCNAVHCAAHHLTTCGECGRRHCPSHILACHVDGKPYCVLHQATCAACGRHHCKEHTAACQICGQPVCSACQGKKGVCRLCATLGPIPANDPRILQAAASMSAAGVRPKSVTGWILAETPERRIIVARLMLSDHLFVFRTSDGAPLAHKAFGMFERGVFKFS